MVLSCVLVFVVCCHFGSVSVLSVGSQFLRKFSFLIKLLQFVAYASFVCFLFVTCCTSRKYFF